MMLTFSLCSPSHSVSLWSDYLYEVCPDKKLKRNKLSGVISMNAKTHMEASRFRFSGDIT